MRDYGKVHVSFWASETIRDLADDAKLLALYLLTSPHTHMSGAFRLPEAYACDDMNWTPERLRNGFTTLSDAGWLMRCHRTSWVLIVNFGKFNPPDNPNQRKAVDKQLALIPKECSFSAYVSEKGCSEPLSNGSGNTPVPVPVPVPVEGAVVESIPLDDGTEFDVREPYVLELERAYPRAAVRQELAKARAWTISNPSKRKTRRGIARFLNAWMDRAHADGKQSAANEPSLLPRLEA